MSFREKAGNWILCPNPPRTKQFLFPKFSSSVFFCTFCHHLSRVTVLFTMIKHFLPGFASQEIISVAKDQLCMLHLDPLLNSDCWEQLLPHLYTSYCICHLSYIWVSEQAQSHWSLGEIYSLEHLGSSYQSLVPKICPWLVSFVFLNQLWSRSERQTMVQSDPQPPLHLIPASKWSVAEKRQCGNGFGVIKCLRAAVAVQCTILCNCEKVELYLLEQSAR